MFRSATTASLLSLLTLLQVSSVMAGNEESNAQLSAKTLEIAQAFLWAAGSGDMKKLDTLMADDFIWHNEGDKSLPWIGTWESKDTVMNEFLPAFGQGLKTTSWETEYSFSNGSQAVFMGTMSAVANNSGVDTNKFSWAVRVEVDQGKVKSWNWFEDSFAVSKAYHAKK
jgi:ketosteroid isomerase-like protein